MNKAVPWSIKGIDADARNSAKEAARRAGMTVGEWLNSVIAEQAGGEGEPPAYDDEDDLRSPPAREARQPQRRRVDRRYAAHALGDDDYEEPQPRTVRRRDFEVPYDEPVTAPQLNPHYDPYARPQAPGPQHYAPPQHVQPPYAQPPAREARHYAGHSYTAPARDMQAYAPPPQAETGQALEKVLNRLSDIEGQLNKRGEDETSRSMRRAMARLEARIEALASREDSEYRDQSLNEIDEKLSVIAERMLRKAPPEREIDEGAAGEEDGLVIPRRMRAPWRRRPSGETATAGDNDIAPVIQPPAPPQVAVSAPVSAPVRQPPPAVSPAQTGSLRSSDLARIEAKLNRLLEREAAQSGPPVEGPRAADHSVSGAIAEIARRQSELDGDIRPSRRAAHAPARTAVAPPSPPSERPVEAGADDRTAEARAMQGHASLASLKDDVRALASRLEEMRRDSRSREAQMQAQAQRQDAAAPQAEIQELRNQISEMSKTLAGLAPRESIASLETAVRDLVTRVNNSRDDGMRESLLQPIEALIGDLKKSFLESAPSAALDSMEQQIRTLNRNMENMSGSGLDAETLARVHDQTREIRDLLAAAAARSLPVDNIEQQIHALSNRIDLIASRGYSPVGGQAVNESVNEIRAALEAAVPVPVLRAIEQRIETLSRKLDEGVAQPQDDGKLDTITRRIDALQDSLQDSLAAGATAASAVPVQNNAALERMLQDIMRKISDTREEPAARNDQAALEEMVRDLGAKLDQSIAAANGDRGLSDVAARIDELQKSMTWFASRHEAPTPSQQLEKLEGMLQDVMRELAGRKDDAGAAPADLDALAADVDRRIESRLQALQDGVTGNVIASLESQIRALDAKIDQGGGSADSIFLESLEAQVRALAKKIDESTVAVAAQASAPSAEAGASAIAALAGQVQALADKVDRVSVAPSMDAGMSAIASVEEQVRALAGRIDQASMAGGGASAAAIEALEAQVRGLSENLEALTRSSEASSIAALEKQIAGLAQKIDQAGANPASVPLESLERQIALLSDRIERSDANLGVLAGLDNTIQKLFDQLAETRSAAVAAAEDAARGVARESIGATGAPAEGLETARELISSEMATLREQQQAADRRAHETLEAVHETLEKVVDRLAFLERDLSGRGNPDRPAGEDDAGRAHAATLASGDAPNFAPAGRAAGPDVTTRMAMLESAAADLGAAPQRQHEPAPEPSIEPGYEPPPRRTAPAAEARSAAAAPAMPAARALMPDPFLEDDIDDDEFLIEPGSGHPPARSAGDAPRDAQRPADGNPSRVQPTEEPRSASSSFIAAARRAQQAAQAQAERAAEEQARTKGNGIGLTLGLGKGAKGGKADKAATDAAAAPATKDGKPAKAGKDKAGSGSLLGRLFGGKKAKAAATDEPVKAAKPGELDKKAAKQAAKEAALKAKQEMTGAKAAGAEQATASVSSLADRMNKATHRGAKAPAHPAAAAHGGKKSALRSRALLYSVAGVVLLLGGWQYLRSTGGSQPDIIRPATPPKGPAKPAPAKAPASNEGASLMGPGPTAPGAGGRAAMLPAGLTPPKTDPTPVASIPRPGEETQARKRNLFEAASAGDPRAMYELGTRYVRGDGVDRHLESAARLLEKAANSGLIPAQYRIGTLYEKGYGVPRNRSRALEWYRKAADAGNVRAMHNYAVLLAEGGSGKTSGKGDFDAAAKWFLKAAEHGVRDSQYNLAILYARGLGITRDLVESYKWFTIAAAQGDADAASKQNDVGRRLTAGQMGKAKAAANSFRPKASDTLANTVGKPKGGWDLSPPATAGAGRKPARS